jgi:hypothetical protein
MARSVFKIVQEAIEIQGYVTVSVNGRDRQAKSITVVDGDWLTDIPTADMCGYVRIRKTKDALVRQARWIIEHADEIRTERQAASAAAARLAVN